MAELESKENPLLKAADWFEKQAQLLREAKELAEMIVNDAKKSGSSGFPSSSFGWGFIIGKAHKLLRKLEDIPLEERNG